MRMRRKIRLTEGNAKSKKITCKCALRQVFICLRLRSPYPPPPPLHTVYVYTVQYILIHTWNGGGGESLTTEKGRGATVHKAGTKIPT
jgi:hypothetical protein